MISPLRNSYLETDIKVVKNKNRDLYRNKVEIQISNGKCGFYKRKSHDLVEIAPKSNSPFKTIPTSFTLSRSFSISIFGLFWVFISNINLK